MWKSIRTDRPRAGHGGLLAALLALTVVVPSTASSPQRFEAVEPHMGTLVRITVYAPDLPTAKAAIDAGFARIRVLDETLSDYKPDSELNRLTREAVGRDMPVSPDLLAVLEASQRLADATDGGFDVTLGPVTRLWREARRRGVVPDANALAQAAGRTGYRRLHLDNVAGTARLDVADMQLDVGAIGKGYAASEALAAITRHGIASALVAVSGDLAFSAAPPGRPGWRIGLHALPVSATLVPQTVTLTHAAVSTSGNASQHLDAGDTRYSHVIDPATAMGLTDDVTVTVVAPTGLQADGLDTAIGIVGKVRGLAMIAQYPEAFAVIVERHGSAVAVTTSKGFESLEAPDGRR